MSRPTLCPVCSCPIQLLIVPGSTWGETKGDIDDALARHSQVVHPESPVGRTIE